MFKRLLFLYRKKVFFKIFLWLLLATSIPAFILTTVSQDRTRTLFQSELVSYKETLNDQIAKSIDENISSMQRQSEALVYNIADIRKLLSYKPDTVDEGYFDASNQVNYFFTSILSNNDRFDGIGLFGLDGAIVSYVNSQGFTPREDGRLSPERLAQTLGAGGGPVIMQADLDLLMKSSIFDHRNNQVIAVLRTLIDNKTGSQAIGISLFAQELTKFGEIVTHGKLAEEDTVVVFAEDGKAVYSNRDMPDTLPGLRELAERKLSREVRQASFRWDGQYAIYDGSSAFGFKVLTLVPERVIAHKLQGVRQIDYLLLLALACSAVLLSFLLSNFITSPLVRLRKSFKRFQRGDFAAAAEVRGEDEFAEIAQGFNTMVASVNVLIEEKLEAEWSRRQSEMESLQSKINPHFLYNTLASIKAVIRSDNADTARRMVQDLSDLFRYTLSKGTHAVPLAEELEHVEKYLRLQKLRFDDAFQVSFDVDPALLRIPILRLTVQPIVENAILHGLEGRSGEGHIRIYALAYGQELRIYVEDDGNGIDAEQTARMNAMLGENVRDNPRNSGRDKVGIFNVNARIKLYYGSEYGLSVQSAPDDGTVVRVTLPLDGGPQHEDTRGGR